MSEEWTENFEKGRTKEEVLIELSNYGALKARVRQLLSETCSLRKQTMRDALVQLIGYQRLVLRLSVSTDEHIRKKEEIEKAQENMPKKVGCSDELKIS